MLASPSVVLLAIAVIAGNVKGNSIRINILKYKVMEWAEVGQLKNQEYKFDFCACEKESPEPENDIRCSCKTEIRGKTTIKSIPYAVYPNSCLQSPDRKCLTTEIKTISDKANVVYIHIHINGASFTVPKWQQLPVSRGGQRTVQLQCMKKKSPSCSTCRTCRAGKIELSYILQDTGDASSSPSSTHHSSIAKNHLPFPRPPQLKSVAHAAKLKPTLGTSDKLVQQMLSPTITTTVELDEDSLNETESAFEVPSEFDRRLFASNDHDRLVRDRLLAASIRHQRTLEQFDIAKFKQHILNLHTGYRRHHGAEPLVYSSDAERAAERWAKRLADEQQCLHHDTNHTYGENLFYYGATWLSDEFTLAEATMSSFYVERKLYNYDHYVHMDYFRTGHFTQLLWADSRKIGVGVGISVTNGGGNKPCHPGFKATMIYISIKYDPPGNVQAPEFYYANVLKPSS